MNAMLINGQPSALLPADDRGLLFGDGVFETLAFHHQRCVLWPRHMARLTAGCEQLGLPPPDPARLEAECRALVDGYDRAVVRITLTRGRGGVGYLPPAAPAPNRIVARREFPTGLERQRERGLDLITSTVRVGSPAPALAGLKHLNRLPQVLIARECMQAGCDEALVLDVDGWLVEALAGNLVLVRGAELVAPGPHPAAVAGVGLAWLAEAADGRLVRRPVRKQALRSSDSLWVINSVRGLCPARSLDGKLLPIDPSIRAWQRRWREEIENPCVNT